MKRQLNITDIAPFAVNNECIAVRGNFAIIRNIASIKEQMVCGGMGDLLYIPLGRILLVTAGTVRLRLNMQPCQVEKGTALVIPENYYMEVMELSADYNAQIATFGGIPMPFKQWSTIPVGLNDTRRIGGYFDLLWEVANSPTCQQATLNDALLPIVKEQNPPPAVKGKWIKIKYVTQLPTAYPQFVFFCNLPQYIRDPYRRYVENRMRELWDFHGVPIDIFFREK